VEKLKLELTLLIKIKMILLINMVLEKRDIKDPRLGIEYNHGSRE
jgi:hypothetical protein